ncbi:MAG: hypothetical protein ACFFAS_02005 [Promethearchaeota archaeon]
MIENKGKETLSARNITSGHDKTNLLMEQKCPYNRSVFQWILKLGLMVFGTIGLIYLHLWVSMVYYILFFFMAMPLKHCQYCYYKIKEPTIDKKTEKTAFGLLSKDEWIESYLKKHVECGKKWSFNFIVLWILPVILSPMFCSGNNAILY